MDDRSPAPPAPFPWPIVTILVVVGLALRIAAAQGALWLDEAWSAVHADAARTPIGVLIGINHDNNHPLNSLWMQAVGIDAAPVIQRALAIVSGTGAIAVAAHVAFRRGREAAIAAAFIFAVSPFFVHYGSEARGYAPMILALLVVLLRVEQWIDTGKRPTMSIALWAAIGTLSQLMMVIGLFAIGLYALVVIERRSGWRTALVESLRTLGPAAFVSAALLGSILIAAEVNSGGMRFGSYEAYTPFHELKALASLAAYTIGISGFPVWPAMLLLAALALLVATRSARKPFYWIALIGFPLLVAIVQPANPGHARYYTLVAVAALFMLAELVASGWTHRHRAVRVGTAIAVGAFATLSLVEDARMIGNQRGDPGRAITAMAARSPGGAHAIVDRDSAVPVLTTAARTARYPLRVTHGCADAEYLLVDRYNGEVLPGPQLRCGRTYLPIATQYARGMTNFHWRLYRRR